MKFDKNCWMVFVLTTWGQLILSGQAEACLRDRYKNEICVGDRVMDAESYVGTVKEAFDNGIVKVMFDGNSDGVWESRSVDELGKSISCNSGICNLGRAIDAAGNIGTVQLVFDNGQVTFIRDWDGSNDIQSIWNLSPATNCNSGICVNDRVIDSGGLVSTVELVFQNGTAEVRFDSDGSLGNRYVSQLSKETVCAPR